MDIPDLDALILLVRRQLPGGLLAVRVEGRDEGGATYWLTITGRGPDRPDENSRWVAWIDCGDSAGQTDGDKATYAGVEAGMVVCLCSAAATFWARAAGVGPLTVSVLG